MKPWCGARSLGARTRARALARVPRRGHGVVPLGAGPVEEPRDVLGLVASPDPARSGMSAASVSSFVNRQTRSRTGSAKRHPCMPIGIFRKTAASLAASTERTLLVDVPAPGGDQPEPRHPALARTRRYGLPAGCLEPTICRRPLTRPPAPRSVVVSVVRSAHEPRNGIHRTDDPVAVGRVAGSGLAAPPVIRGVNNSSRAWRQGTTCLQAQRASRPCCDPSTVALSIRRWDRRVPIPGGANDRYHRIPKVLRPGPRPVKARSITRRSSRCSKAPRAA